MTNYLTIEGFEKLTKQQLFDMSVAHIGQTRQKSVQISDGGSKGCVYSGSGCAAAPFLKPENREIADNVPGLLYTGWGMLVGVSMVPEDNSSLICSLQSCHDLAPSGQEFLEVWKTSMARVAVRYKLSTEKLAAIVI